MTIRLETYQDGIRIVDHNGELPPATKSSLRLRGFCRRDDGLGAEHGELGDLLSLALDLLQEAGCPIRA